MSSAIPRPHSYLSSRTLRWPLTFLALLHVPLAGCASRGSSSAPLVVAPEIVQDEQIGVDDVFEVRVAGEPDLTGLFRVAADGTIDYPYVGRMAVLRKRSGDIQRTIADRLRAGYLKDPQVTVMVKEWNSRKINVLGQVQKPGPVAFFPRMTIVDAVSAAGGFTGIADKNSVRLRRERDGVVNTQVHRVADISEGRGQNVFLMPGDVLVVEERLF